ncbi:Ca-activated chloride channel family protein [Sinosporangium album]|uniref:Ca-activated chloride channel family protein n=1 Tax=Sinosporangium album TaxID=504805 RepID=A0A1G7XKB9_9ACTN|nr:VIT domain-containing protein [Sinosporangium album]SDG84662.1 Ca-activated chloride channel family protein [Sinosporangium album]
MTFTITALPEKQCAPQPDAGLGALRTEQGNLPLESVDVTAAVAGTAAEMAVTQCFRNPHDVPLEATYVFPLPSRAAVTAFTMEADGHVVEGVLKERAQARADYDQALAEGRRAAIAEEDRPDVFTMRVGNIVPGERVTVRLALSGPLPYEDGAATFRFPLVVAPRYVPGAPLSGPSTGAGTAPDTDAVPDASRITPPVLLPGFPDPVRLALAVRFDPAAVAPYDVASSLHVVREEESGDGVVVRLEPGERLDRDFILRLRFPASNSLTLVPDEPGRTDAESGEGDGTFLLTVVPPEGERRTPKDVVLLLDRSGSMGGWKMVAARRAAARIVDTLTSDDRFAVFSFDHVVERPDGLSAGLVPASDRNRFRAVEHLAGLSARGGTELLRPLSEAIALLTEDGGGGLGRDRVLVLVTDGQVANEDEILARIGPALADVRMHTVGIDRAVNAAFLGRLAGLGSGRCELVESEDRLDAAMEHIHRRVGAPLVTGLRMSADGLDLVDGSVEPFGSLFSGVPLTVSGRFRGAAAGSLTLSGTGPDGEPWERRVEGAAGGGGAVRAMWARGRVRALEDRYAIGAQGWPTPYDEGERALEEKIVATSLRYGVLSRFTAFVAVDSRVVGEGGPGHRVVQPVELPSGWEPPVPPAPSPGAPIMLAAASYGGADAFGAPPPAPAAGGFAQAVPPPAAGPRMVGRARMSAPAPAPAGNTLAEVRPQLVQELERLAGVDRLSPRELRGYLADLGSRLSALASHLGGHPDLSALARDLEAAEEPGSDPGDLLARVRDLLRALTGEPGPGAAERPSFWKRR